MRGPVLAESFLSGCRLAHAGLASGLAQGVGSHRVAGFLAANGLPACAAIGLGLIALGHLTHRLAVLVHGLGHRCVALDLIASLALGLNQNGVILARGAAGNVQHDRICFLQKELTWKRTYVIRLSTRAVSCAISCGSWRKTPDASPTRLAGWS